jgi:16S rRNA (cytosine1402-N4)-methyltransferase
VETDSNIPERDGHGQTTDATVGHVPVLLKEAIDFLTVKRGGTYLDATVGLGGHSYEIAKRLGAPGHLIGFDKDPAALERAHEKLKALDEPPQITLIHGSFAEVGERIAPASLDGLMADLGVSSLQLGDAARGFSFQADGPLDMRMNPMSGDTAEQVVNHLDERKLADVIYEFGEERRSRRIARAIVRSRPIRTTKQLVEVVSASAR